MVRSFRKGAVVRMGAAVITTGAVIIASLLGGANAALADTAPTPPVPATVSADSLPTAQINGIVWAQAIIGNTVYAGGQFSSARPAGASAGTSEVPRSNLMSYDITTGVMTSFAPTVDGPINAIAVSPDGSTIYIGGSFMNVNGVSRQRIAALNATTGAVVAAFNPKPNAVVRGIAVSGSTVYYTGNFTQVAGNDRARAAASTTSGALLPWSPQLSARGNAIAVSQDGSKIALGGIFDSLNGSSNPGYGLGIVDSTAGGLLPASVNQVIRNAGANAAILSLKTAGDSFYGNGYVFGSGGNLEGSFRADWATGSLTWVEDCHGDTYDVFPVNGVVYAAGHPHYCGSLESGFPQSNPWTFRRGVAFSDSVNRIAPYGLNLGYFDFGGNPQPDLLNWFPDFNAGSVSGDNQGPWSITGNSDYVSYAGEFTTVNGAGQQGLSRFAVSSKAPNKQGPRNANGSPTLVSIGSGSVRVSWPLAWDRDNEFLTYDLIRDGKNSAPIWTSTVKSKSPDWGLPPISYIDSGLAAGSTHTYKVRTTDPKGNVAWGTAASVVVNGTGSTSGYNSAVLASSPVAYWPLDDTTGPSYDWAGANDLTVGAVTRGVPGAINGASATAMSFSGDSSSFAASTSAVPGPQTFAIEAWFKTTTTAGGKIVGFGNSATGNSSSYDRHIYMDSSGRVNFGVYPGTSRVISSANAYNDGQWHQVVASLGSGGMTLFIDGTRVASRTDTTSAQPYSGFWRIGGDSSWADSNYFAGSIDEVSIYSAPLTRDTVLAHYAASGRVSSAPAAPTDAYGAAVYAAQPDLYWRMSEPSGPKALDYSGQDSGGTYQGTEEFGVTGALAGSSDSAVRFSGGSLIGTQAYNNPTTYSLEAWVRTTSTSGGKIIGFGDNPNGDSSSYDRHIFMLDSGKLRFGVWIGSESTIDSTQAVNDGAWHYVVATQSPDGMRLYIDGALQASNSQTSAQPYSGYWHVGRDVTWGGSSSPAFVGTIDEVAVYSQALTAAAVSQHYSLGSTGAPANIPPTAAFTASASKLRVSVDGTGSTDPDGTVAGYSWNWGDGTPDSTGPTADHTFQSPGTKTVTLTVTDDRGAIATHVENVTTVANVAPSASFTVGTPAGLAVTTDASASLDTDGTISTYSWDWGDGSAPSGGAAGAHTYTATGTYAVTLTVTDNDGAQASATHAVSVLAPPPNQAPVAAFTSSSNGLTLTVDGSASADSDGTITSYAWTWGDSTADGSTRQTSHSFSAAGTYQVTLTVTDDDGATGSITKPVTVTSAQTAAYATDAFERNNATGFGTADVGGAWTTSGTASAFSTSGGAAKMTHASAATTYSAFLNAVSSNDTAVVVDYQLAALPTGASEYASVIARKVGAADYRARVVINPAGAVTLQLQQSSTTLAAVATGVTVNAGSVLRIKVVATGTSPTALKAKVWKATDPEPTDWKLSVTDATAALQAAGGVGLASYLGATTTNLPFTSAFDNFGAGPSTTVVTPPQPPTNQAPTAAFTATAAGLVASVDGSASSDPDGSISSYSWNWGDGTPAGSGATAQHAYGSTGSYTVTLTVTDNGGLAATSSATVAVASPPPAGADIARDGFERTNASAWGDAEMGGSWSGLTAGADYSVDGHSGLMALAAGATRSAYLSSVSSTDTSLFTEVTVNRPVASTSYLSSIVRRVGSADYRARLVVSSTGAVNIQLQAAGTTIAAASTGLTIADGQAMRVRVEAIGTNPTQLRARVWLAGTDEPTTWNLEKTDASAALQAAGAVGLSAYVGSATNVPYIVTFQRMQALASGNVVPVLAGQ